LALRAGQVRWRAALLIGSTGMLAAPLGVALAQRVPQAVLVLVFAAFLLWTAWRMAMPGAAAQPSIQPPCIRPPGQTRIRWSRSCALALARVGAVAGLLSGLLGVGGGFVIVPALDRHSNLDLPTIQATSLAVIALVALAGLSAASWQGTLAWSAAAPFTLAVAAGLLLGRRLAGYLSPQVLRRIFAAVAVVVALLLLGRLLGWIA
jgi:uncharacterized membrane protein YfcA